MLGAASVTENLRFLILEVRRQVDRTREYLARPSRELLESALARDDYIDNLKGIIQRKCFTLAADASREDPMSVEFLKAIDVVAMNLERIADFCESILGQVDHVERPEVLARYDFTPLFDAVLAGVSRVEEAVLQRSVQLALEICRVEPQLDRLHAGLFQRVLQELKQGQEAQAHLTILFISHYLERMGDSLLNVGEAVLSASVGERVKVDQFLALEDSLEAVRADRSIEDVELENLAETRSGCRVTRVSDRDDEEQRPVIFKEGRPGKLGEEKRNLERWAELMPGLVPQVNFFFERGETSAILYEYLPGATFEKLLLQPDSAGLDLALRELRATLQAVWTKTRRDEAASAGFLRQLADRLGDVYAVHPAFRERGAHIGSVDILPFEELLARARSIESRLLPPFSVLVHGDLNVDNIILDPRERAIRFIDLHRSTMMDYVQDVSVFLVSNYRTQVFRAPIRDRIQRVILEFYEFARSFAVEHGDRTFGARLALGLARSFASSTRFILDEEFARSMFLRARYLLEQLLARDPAGIQAFEVPREALVD
jgi:phosphate uptake regulator/aminoglycoside phosphotransferase (APT) family kinase protein